ncbi:MAG: hypothetical protein QOF91_1523 [Alphaproteobacteria bacterium]|nr:hypothetical protein [Alphaproteobacteria bacterium]
MQNLTELMKWLEASPLNKFIAESGWSFQSALMLHIVAITIVFGMILVVDLRLMGVASKTTPVTDLLRVALPWTWWSFAGAVLSGAFLFMAQPEKYFVNVAFQMKFLLMAAAGLNMLIFHFITYRKVSAWDRDAPVPLAGKVAGLVSLGCWTAAIAYGRWTAYSMF